MSYRSQNVIVIGLIIQDQGLESSLVIKFKISENKPDWQFPKISLVKKHASQGFTQLTENSQFSNYHKPEKV